MPKYIKLNNNKNIIFDFSHGHGYLNIFKLLNMWRSRDCWERHQNP